MKLCVCLESIFAEVPFLERVEEVKKMGFSAFEFWGWEEKNIERLEGKKRENQLEIAIFSGNEKSALVNDPSSFYETFSPETAFDLSQRFRMVYTPKKASWLNMAEIELSTLSKQCLDRRIGDIETFSKEVYAWAREHDRQKPTISWQFTKNDAREKLNRHYHSIRN